MEKLNLFAEELKISPEEYIIALFQNTENGVLDAPRDILESGEEDGPHTFYRCEMQWTEADRDAVIKDWAALFDAFKTIAASSEIEPYNVVVSTDPAWPQAVRRVWEQYVRAFGGREKYNTDEYMEAAEKEMFEKEALTEAEKALLEDYWNDFSRDACTRFEEGSLLCSLSDPHLENGIYHSKDFFHTFIGEAAEQARAAIMQFAESGYGKNAEEISLFFVRNGELSKINYFAL